MCATALKWRHLVNAYEAKAGPTWLDCEQLIAVCIGSLLGRAKPCCCCPAWQAVVVTLV